MISVIRGDTNSIHIGKNSNIQDLSILHVTHNNHNTANGSNLVIGDNVTIGHNCTLHGCTINNNVLVGMGSIILDNSLIEANVVIGAGSLISQSKVLSAGYLYFGNPIKQIRKLTAEEIVFIQYSADHYVKLMQQYQV